MYTLSILWEIGDLLGIQRKPLIYEQLNAIKARIKELNAASKAGGENTHKLICPTCAKDDLHKVKVRSWPQRYVYECESCGYSSPHHPNDLRDREDK